MRQYIEDGGYRDMRVGTLFLVLFLIIKIYKYDTISVSVWVRNHMAIVRTNKWAAHLVDRNYQLHRYVTWFYCGGAVYILATEFTSFG